MTTMNRNKRAPMGAAAVIGLLFAGGLQAGVFFDFNDGSLQGWTDLAVAGTHDGPRNWAGAPPAFPGAGHDGTPGLGQNLVGGNQDSTHPVLWLRSPEFTQVSHDEVVTPCFVGFRFKRHYKVDLILFWFGKTRAKDTGENLEMAIKIFMR